MGLPTEFDLLRFSEARQLTDVLLPKESHLRSKMELFSNINNAFLQLDQETIDQIKFEIDNLTLETNLEEYYANSNDALAQFLRKRDEAGANKSDLLDIVKNLCNRNTVQTTASNVPTSNWQNQPVAV